MRRAHAKLLWARLLGLARRAIFWSNQGMLRAFSFKWAFALGFGALTLVFAGDFARARPPLVPQAMLDACAAHREGEACQFEMQEKRISGACAPLPDKTLACRPGGKPKSAKPAPPSPGSQAP